MVKDCEMYHEVMAYPFRNVSEWWSSIWGRDFIYKGLLTWYDMWKKHICSFRNGPPYQKKKDSPLLEAENIIIYIKDKYSNKHLKPLAHFAIGISSHSCLMKTQHATQTRPEWKSFCSINASIFLWSIIPHLAITVQPPGTEKMGSRMKKRFLETDENQTMVGWRGWILDDFIPVQW